MPSEHHVVVIHSSDLHLGADSVFQGSAANLPVLYCVLAAAERASAQLVVLAGDVFDHNRQTSEVIEAVAGTLAGSRVPIVILPGNHDPLTPDSVYRRPEFDTRGNVHVLGLDEETSLFQDLGLEVWGKAHTDYLDMQPLPEPPARKTRWQLAVAHGHYVEEPPDSGRLLGSWLIRQEQLTASAADYVALGHWNRAARVGDEHVRAYYSGSPSYAGTVNLIRFDPDHGVEVTQVPVDEG
jgi:DNA repair exonuclease SbcCD nuclease subunit